MYKDVIVHKGKVVGAITGGEFRQLKDNRETLVHIKRRHSVKWGDIENINQ
jgi:hypothetical protein